MNQTNENTETKYVKRTKADQLNLNQLYNNLKNIDLEKVFLIIKMKIKLTTHLSTPFKIAKKYTE